MRKLGWGWRAGLLALGLLGASAAWSGEVLSRVTLSGTLRVCIWPDYYGISYREPATGQLSGIDIDLARELARELDLKLEHIDSSFAALITDLHSDRCDVAMFAVGMLPERMQRLRFTRPYLRSGIYAVTHKGSAIVGEWSDIDRPGVRVGVQAGTFMEPVMAKTLRQAQLVTVRPPDTRERELASGRIDVFMTDYPYSRRLLDKVEWAQLITPPEPFNPLPYAYAVKPGDEAWLERIDGFVRRVQKDGRLLEAARRHGLKDIVVR
ncbi:ABC-type amino acid transport substrate-binding protein [Inhella inkyongensis]|uniref:ABC-type amino acid transport substrate-binding protein n=1 Tax=Inhella inkyongensis TaxID=392593 RepID=A0A840S3T2_9BURK|nr:ABC transporter substrate-binding protein [Inhella inkyongensis]MBB5205015.1 ABC-type amino acid transport substrate-binding protein [Inhella inkyongensis]